MAIYLIRHGETVWARDHRHTGRTDLPLTAKGEAQASELKSRLAGVEFARVLSSPLQRAMMTAQLSDVWPRAEATPALMEFDYGEYEGMTSPEIRATRPDWELWRDGCPGGESPHQVLLRSQRLLVELQPHADLNYALFTHGHILRALAAAHLGLTLDLCGHLIVKVASISILGREGEVPAIEAWNLT
ncbi:MAG TPA: histidine phosphatase family protein [Candidatus Micrarchaeaceae archaeon]|nr:histidine phosphatase family protein [Candidatus Micrarchaeaceae archaeon]